MTHLIRNQVFETNSSSCHSVSVQYGDVFDGLTPDANNEIVIYPGEFGWGYYDRPEEINDPLTKIAYCWQDTCEGSKQREMLEKVVLEHTGASKLRMQSTFDDGSEGYIDHQSAGTSHKLFADEWTLKNFLFSPNSVLTLDHDNH